MKLLCADTDFGTQTELRSVCKGCRYVDIYAGGVHITTEPLGTSLVFGYNTFAVFGTVFLNMRYGLTNGLNGFNGHLVVQDFRTEVFLRGLLQ